MELREYIKILGRNISTIVYTVIIFVIVVYIWSAEQSKLFTTELLLNIGRLDNQSTAEYKFDEFYRVQADEKFAKNIEEWLKIPGVISSIFVDAGIKDEPGTIGGRNVNFQATAISPESVKVKFSVATEDEARKLGGSVGKIIDNKTTTLNSEAKDPNWFKVSSDNLIIYKNTQNLPLNLGLALIIGLCVGLFLALFKHYVLRRE